MRSLLSIEGFLCLRLNESPSEKEGKCEGKTQAQIVDDASMKVPPKRKGNMTPAGRRLGFLTWPQ